MYLVLLRKAGIDMMKKQDGAGFKKNYLKMIMRLLKKAVITEPVFVIMMQVLSRQDINICLVF